MSYRKEKIGVECAYCGVFFEPSERVRYDIRKKPEKKRFCTKRCMGFSSSKLKIPFHYDSAEYRKEKYRINKEKIKTGCALRYAKNKQSILSKRAQKKYGEYGVVYIELRNIEKLIGRRQH